jgi:hypothetical protein
MERGTSVLLLQEAAKAAGTLQGPLPIQFEKSWLAPSKAVDDSCP